MTNRAVRTKFLTIDERCRITLGTKLVEPGATYAVTQSPDGTITLVPARVEVHDARE